ncbi:MAG: hypothetical protein HC890_06060 [Chloroflexaceae bacterium]|nr:hypothetical protein [Chloroflexaceae bacterium]
MKITLDIPDTLKQELTLQADQLNLSLETFILQKLETLVHQPEPPDEYDPITPLIGTLDIGTTDLGENHDYYIGQALLRELRSNE